MECKQTHTEVTEKDVFGWLLDKEEEKLNINPADDSSLEDSSNKEAYIFE